MKFVWMSIVCFAIVPTLAAADPVDLSVADYACARQIIDRMPASPVDCMAFNLPGPVYLWVRLRGGPNALESLEAGNEIVIRHKWVRYVGPSLQVETIEAEEDIPVGAIDPQLLVRLRNEVDMRGYFDWRTWSSKNRLRRTRYSVEVLNQSFAEIPCRPSEGTTANCGLQVTIEGQQ
jgi:hypothetical protein